ncbi:MAG: 1-deoxy-D-xylulose-5-phosphate reductoisomerase [Nitrospinales bacterium]
MKKIALLGSTGSIGVNTLDVIDKSPGQFEVLGMTAGSSVDQFAEQAKKFKPKMVSLFDETKHARLKELLAGEDIEILCGEEGSVKVATIPEVDLVVSGVVGCAGLVPTYAAVQAGKDIALANKETLVVAGELVLKEAKGKCNIIPVDSEHSAIFQTLVGENPERIKKIVLTASGGPFRTHSLEQMESVTVEEALNHPNWSMGPKITIDSATMMNKGLEYIEAKWLFGLDVPVEIIVHAQSIIHSMVEFVDTSMKAQLGLPDMRVPIAYALAWPDRVECEFPSLDLAAMKDLTFEAPDFQKFPCLKLAFQALEAGGTIPAVLNAANEVAVQAFLDRQISFKEIPEIIRAAMDNHNSKTVNAISDVIEADQWAREETHKLAACA